MEENCHQQEELENRDRVPRASGLVEWLVEEDGSMGDNNNDIWDWDSNNK